MKVALHDCQTEELDIEAAINFACFVMTNARSLYTQLSVEQKRRLLAILGPSGFTLDGDGGIRTVTSECVFNGLYETAAVLVTGGTPGGNCFEPRLYGWLRELVKLRDIFMADPATAQLLTA